MIVHDLAETFTTVAVGLIAWIAVAAGIATAAIFGAVAAGWWTWRALRGAWRGLSRPHSHSRDSRVADMAPEPPQRRTAPRTPAWAHTDHHNHQDTP